MEDVDIPIGLIWVYLLGRHSTHPSSGGLGLCPRTPSPVAAHGSADMIPPDKPGRPSKSLCSQIRTCTAHFSCPLTPPLLYAFTLFLLCHVLKLERPRMLFLAVTSRESSRLPLLKLSKGGHHNHLTKNNLQNILSCTAFIIPGSGNHLGTMSIINTGALKGEWNAAGPTMLQQSILQ